jgi:hypothetical protein
MWKCGFVQQLRRLDESSVYERVLHGVEDEREGAARLRGGWEAVRESAGRRY